MPYKSEAQSRFIHAKAGEGTPWAKKFVADAQHGKGSVSKLPERLSQLASKRQSKAKK